MSLFYSKSSNGFLFLLSMKTNTFITNPVNWSSVSSLTSYSSTFSPLITQLQPHRASYHPGILLHCSLPRSFQMLWGHIWMKPMEILFKITNPLLRKHLSQFLTRLLHFFTFPWQWSLANVLCILLSYHAMISPAWRWAPRIQGSWLVHLCISNTLICVWNVVNSQYIFPE